ncbi:MAG: TetR/AcrR family transcriptional regulator [Acidobacteriota bacterium]
MTRPARVSADRILTAAALEFAERGFGGARVDRIARRARVNKAMIYYHFKSKQALYRRLLRDLFTLVGTRLQQIAAGAGSPGQKIDKAIAVFAEMIQQQAAVPAIMLREVAERGAHLDPETLAALTRVPRLIAAIVQEGVDAGVFRPVNPVFAHFTLFAPVLFYLAGAPIRQEITDLQLMNLSAATPADFVQHMQETARRALARDVPARSSR